MHLETYKRAFEEVTPEAERSTITFKDLVTKLEAHFKTGSNTTLANFEFRKLCQKDDEGFDVFATRVKREARKCDFTCTNANCTVRDTLARDQIITGMSSDEIRKHALKNQWALDDLIKNGRQLEAASDGVVQLKNSHSEISSNKIRRTKRPGKYSKKNERNIDQNSKPPQNKCITCSSKFCKGGNRCPGTKIECFDCHKQGHFRGAKICQKRKTKKQTRRVESDEEETATSESSESSEQSDDSSDEEPKRSYRVSMKNVTKVRRMRIKRSIRRASNSKRYEVEVIIMETPVKAFADTGADICIMSKKKARKLGLKLQKTKMAIRPYGSKKMKCCGFSTVTVMHNERVANIALYVINKDVETLLSGAAAEELGIITFNSGSTSQYPVYDEMSDVRIAEEDHDPYKKQIRAKYPSLTSNRVGKLRDYQVKYYIDENVPPVVEARRPIAYHLQDKFNREIENMIADGIVEEHHGPAPWVSNTVLQPKPDGGMRITVDMSGPNQAIKQTNIPIPRVEDIKARMAGNELFSKLDFKSAFFQLELDEDSKILTVFHAGNKLLRLNRVVQGCCPSSGEMSKALAPLFRDIRQAHLIQDDLIIAAKNKQEHDEVLDKVLQVIEESGMTLNLKKCIFGKDEIPFWGLIISKDGLKPDPKKVDALKTASPPSSKAEITSFLCMMQSNKDFIPNLASRTQHMRKRLKKNYRFTWDKYCQKEFEDLKNSFSSETLLHHYDPKERTFISVDAHKTGLSAILMQGKTRDTSKPIAFASRTTTPAEQRYPQLDLEALSIDFGLRRFRYYIVGGPAVDVITDHKPLISIFANRRKGSIRTSCIKHRHQDIHYNVVWRKGCSNPADYLSRHAISRKDPDESVQNESSEFEKTIWYIHYGPYIESIAMHKIIKETDQDPTLRQLKSFIKKGFIPSSVKNLTAFRKIFDCLTISDDGLVMKNEKIILPKALYNTAMEKAHQGAHPGMSGMKRRLRSHFWFPQMDLEIEKFVNGCGNCQMFTNKRTKHPITPITSPKTPWENVSIDLFGPMPDHKHVVVVLDSASRFPAAKIVPNTSTKPVLKAIDDIYTDYGQPLSHRTDNGPPFNSVEFATFSHAKGIEHVKTFPYHPQANPVETFMKPLGKTMKTAYYNKTDKDVALKQLLSSYRSTPHPSTGEAPGAIMFRNGYKTEFPQKHLSDESVAAAFQHDQHQKLERGHAINASKHRMISPLAVGDHVYMRNLRHSKFQPIFGPEMYTIISLDNGGAVIRSNNDRTTYRRHLDDIKLAPCSSDDPNITWFPPDQNIPTPPPDATIDQPTDDPSSSSLPRRSTRNTRPPPYLDDYVRLITEV